MINTVVLLEGLGMFSRENCVAICSALVPLNLSVTIATLVFLYQRRPVQHLQRSAAIASVFALILCLHVSSWFVIGVITPVTFILFGLALTCLTLNWGAVYVQPWVNGWLNANLGQP